ncbi:MAG: helix-turn-helix transcriptional regulator [Eubacteriales bacterium]|nr:helix-turn-helix transcriptional regulator [Eubacteriales bacterium]
MIKYDRLWKTMKERGVSQYDMYTYHNISRSQLDRFRKNKNAQLYTLDKICSILNCKIEDIVEIIPDGQKLNNGISLSTSEDADENNTDHHTI